MALFGRPNRGCMCVSSRSGSAIAASPVSLRDQQFSVNPDAAGPQQDSSCRLKERSRSRTSLILAQLQHVLSGKRSKPRVASSEAAATAGST